MATWVEFIARVWPVAHRYRVLLALRRGEYGEAIHGLLGPVDELLADLVKRGQDSDLSALAQTAVSNQVRLLLLDWSKNTSWHRAFVTYLETAPGSDELRV